MADPLQPSDPANAGLASGTAAEPRPSEADVVKALVEVEQATRNGSSPTAPPAHAVATQSSWLTGSGPVVVFVLFGFVAILGLTFLLARGIQRGANEVSRELSNAAATRVDHKGVAGGTGSAPVGHAIDPTAQEEAEKLLARVAAGDSAAAFQVLVASGDWTGKTHRTPRTDQLITTSLNLSDTHMREAAIQAQLALDAVPRDESGLAMLKQAVGNPDQRGWALWMLGALGNRGVDPIHTAKIIESYLGDPDANVRASAVDALSLVGTDETVPMLLDRFRNDPSPVVQERAACDIAQSGMYTQAQRLAAAASLVGWLDDSLLSAQQRAWAVQALGDISGKNFGADSSAWKSWYDSAR